MPFKIFDVEGIGKVAVYKRRGARSLRLRLGTDGTVKVTIPYWSTYQTGLDFTRSRSQWILQQMPASNTRLLTDGMAVGKMHRLLFQQRAGLTRVTTSVRKSEVVVAYSPMHEWQDESVQQAAHAACLRALKQEATELLIPRLNSLATSYGFAYRSVRIKRMTSRWGSCDQKQNIVLNLFLVQLSWEHIDYVLLHELTHTKALNHGTDFWNQFESVLPDAKQQRRAMKQYRPELMRAASNPMA